MKTNPFLSKKFLKNICFSFYQKIRNQWNVLSEKTRGREYFPTLRIICSAHVREKGVKEVILMIFSRKREWISWNLRLRASDASTQLRSGPGKAPDRALELPEIWEKSKLRRKSSKMRKREMLTKKIENWRNRVQIALDIKPFILNPFSRCFYIYKLIIPSILFYFF